MPYEAQAKAVEGYRSPRRSATFNALKERASVLDCASPGAFLPTIAKAEALNTSCSFHQNHPNPFILFPKTN